MITLYYTNTAGSSYPVNFRLCNKQEGKTKNDYFHKMVLEVIQWGIEPAWVTGDNWYPSLENLKFLRDQKVGFLFGIANNRKVSTERGTSRQVKTVEISNEGLMVHLKAFG